MRARWVCNACKLRNGITDKFAPATDRLTANKTNTQRQNTTANASNLNDKWSWFRIPISGLIRIRIAAKMLWIYYLLGVSHFAECRENRPVTVWEMLTNLLKSPIRQWWGKWKSDPESVSGTASSSPNVNQFICLVGSIIIRWNRLITFAVILHTDRQTDRMTDKSIWSYDLCLGEGNYRRTGKRSRTQCRENVGTSIDPWTVTKWASSCAMSGLWYKPEDGAKQCGVEVVVKLNDSW